MNWQSAWSYFVCINSVMAILAFYIFLELVGALIYLLYDDSEEFGQLSIQNLSVAILLLELPCILIQFSESFLIILELIVPDIEWFKFKTLGNYWRLYELIVNLIKMLDAFGALGILYFYCSFI